MTSIPPTVSLEVSGSEIKNNCYQGYIYLWGLLNKKCAEI